jgi:hypothetical protein
LLTTAESPTGRPLTQHLKPLGAPTQRPERAGWKVLLKLRSSSLGQFLLGH